MKERDRALAANRESPEIMDQKTLKTRAKRALLKPAFFFNHKFAYMARIDMAFSRGALNVATRRLDVRRPATWEFSAFSQNGEDGIIDHLLSLVQEPNRYFLEIGAGDGLENNSAHLAFAKKYDGIMIEGDAVRSADAQRFLQPINWSVRYLDWFVEPGHAPAVINECIYIDPDLFSLDIDSNDYFVMKALLESGLRPKVVCVEYNSAFGPVASLSIQHTPRLNYLTHHPSQLYYGVSVAGWRQLLEGHGYRFICVDARGVNAFFVEPARVPVEDPLERLSFAENRSQLQRHSGGWEHQFAQIAHLPFVTI